MPNGPYEEGRNLGRVMAAARANGDGSYDCRYDLADAAKRGVLAEFKRGLNDGLSGG